MLWEDKEDTPALRTQLRIHVSDLTRTLKRLNCWEILNIRRNQFAIAVNAVDCDYYDFLRSDAAAVNAYRGEYMKQYSWAEMTLGTLESSRKDQ